jgi:hypothetical protein
LRFGTKRKIIEKQIQLRKAIQQNQHQGC